MDSFLTGLAWFAASINILILISSLDDLFIDVYFWTRQAYRAATVRRKHPPLRLEQLKAKAERPFALMIPAWREFSVIARMAENALASLEYEKFVLFFGTYPNDPETGAEVDRMARRFRNIRRVEVPHPGPTCKADCLNRIIQAIFAYEREAGEAFAGIVLHDSEDVIHPLELKLFNYLVDRKDLIQLPVLSLEREWFQWVAGTYQDDFAEWHSKDLVVRESLTGLVPSAGVGTCFSRRAMAALCEGTGDAPFNTDTLTEDYDFSFRLGKLGMPQVFVKVPVAYPTKVRRILGGTRTVVRRSLVGVREYFPDTFRTAYRQRARWILGIGLQGWQILGWRGSLGLRYQLFRDRKGIFTSIVNILALGLFLLLGSLALAHRWGGQAWAALPASFAADGWIMRLMVLNGLFMANRCLQRFIFVGRLFGPIQGLLSIPRILVGNFVNFAASLRAWRLFILHLVAGKRLTWDKTQHTFPTDKELQPFRRKLGEILVSWKEIDPEALERALDEQRGSRAPLGRILLRNNAVTEAVLADAIAEQAGLPRSSVNLETLRTLPPHLPTALALRYDIVPLGVGEEGEDLIGVSAPPSEAVRRGLQGILARPPRFFIITESERAMALSFFTGGRLRPRESFRGHRLLGDLLRERSGLSEGDLAEALADFDPARDGKLGQFLVKRSLVTPAALEEALRNQATLLHPPPAGT